MVVITEAMAQEKYKGLEGRENEGTYQQSCHDHRGGGGIGEGKQESASEGHSRAVAGHVEGVVGGLASTFHFSSLPVIPFWG